MDFKIEKNQLLKGLYAAAGIADRKSTMPVLANVLLRSDGRERILCIATDLNVTAITSLPAQVAVEGGLTVGAKQLHEITRGLGGDTVHVKRTEQNWAQIKSGRAEFKLVGIPERDFPKLPALAEATLGRVDSIALRDMIAKTVFSVSTDDTRQHLAGVLFESDGMRARMVSTDGHRLSKIERELIGAPKLETGVLIPRKGIQEIRRALDVRETPCDIGVFQGHFVLKIDDVTLSVKLGDGQFPPYEQVIPKDNDKFIVAPRDALLEVFRRVSIMASDKTKGVRFSLDKGQLTIEADNPDLGNAREVLEVPEYKGGPVTAGFNSQYFLDILSEISSTDVRIEVAGELDPAVVRPGDGSDYLGVIMPMRL